MNSRLACLVVAGLTLVAAAPGVIASGSEPVSNVEILVNGTPPTSVRASGPVVHRGPQGP
jgi:hypothetical protein